MNLIKSFNFKYLKENIKKSRGLIILASILVPIFTLLITALVLNGEVTRNLIRIEDVAIINILGLFIVPIALSMSLFGYVYKKTSVDLVNSMPLNRKTIFVTNTIGGIIIITLIQLITAIVLIACNLVCSNLFMFPQMIFDLFLSMWISYIFVFLATNIAMALSGTQFTQIVLTMLILFLIPFSHITFNDFYSNYQYVLVNESGQFSETEYTNRNYTEYTMPFHIFTCLFIGGNIYSNESIVKMLILGVCYYFIGLYFFKKRKMENTEESFSNVKVHLFVKALTIFPMMVLLNMVEFDITFSIIALSCIAVYYFVYDFIVKRKVNFKVSFPAMVIILVVLQILCMGIEYCKDSTNKTEKIYATDVKGVSITFRNSNHYSSNVSNYFMNNEDIINYIYSIKDFSKKDYNSNSFEKATVTVEEISDKNAEEYVAQYYANVRLRGKNNKLYNFTITMNAEELNELISLLEKDENYCSAIKNEYIEYGKFYVARTILDDDINEIINKEIKNKINSMTLKDIVNIQIASSDFNITKYNYRNHNIVSTIIPVNITEDVLKTIAEDQNNFTKKVLEKNNERSYNAWVNYGIANETNEIYSYGFFRDFYHVNAEMTDFVNANLNEPFDPQKNYYIIEVSCSVHQSAYLFTNKTEEIEALMEQEKYLRSIESEEIYYDKGF